MQVNQRCAARGAQQPPVWHEHVQLLHLKVDRGHYEVRIIEDLPLQDCVTKVTKLVDNGSDIVDGEEYKLSTRHCWL